MQRPLSGEGKAHNRRDSRQSSSLVLDVVLVPRYPDILTDLNHSDVLGNWSMCEATNETPQLRAEISSGVVTPPKTNVAQKKTKLTLEHVKLRG